MKIKRIIVISVYLFSSLLFVLPGLIAQNNVIKIPAKEYYPQIVDDLYYYFNRDDILFEGNYQDWRVYSDRANNYTTTLPGGKIIKDTLDLTEELFVIEVDKTKKYLRIARAEDINDGRLIEGKEDAGWISFDNLLLNEGNIDYIQRFPPIWAIVKNTINSDSSIFGAVNFIMSPDSNCKKINTRNNLVLYIIYKECNGYLLLGTPANSRSDDFEIFGWVPKSNTQEWRMNSLQLKINDADIMSKKMGDKKILFDTPAEVIQFYNTFKDSENNYYNATDYYTDYLKHSMVLPPLFLERVYIDRLDFNDMPVLKVGCFTIEDTQIAPLLFYRLYNSINDYIKNNFLFFNEPENYDLMNQTILNCNDVNKNLQENPGRIRIVYKERYIPFRIDSMMIFDALHIVNENDINATEDAMRKFKNVVSRGSFHQMQRTLENYLRDKFYREAEYEGFKCNDSKSYTDNGNNNNNRSYKEILESFTEPLNICTFGGVIDYFSSIAGINSKKLLEDYKYYRDVCWCEGGGLYETEKNLLQAFFNDMDLIHSEFERLKNESNYGVLQILGKPYEWKSARFMMFH